MQASEIEVGGLKGSSAALLFASLRKKLMRSLLFILNDADEAGYFFQDLKNIIGDESSCFFFPSSFKRSVKYAQQDQGNEILRTDVLSHLSSSSRPIFVVAYPEAIAELVASNKQVSDNRIAIANGDTVIVTTLCQRLREMGFEEKDYVYQPGQFAMRGSIIDVYSYSHEYPYRIDFFGDEVDSIRTFSIEDQLSIEKKQQIDIVPELSESADCLVPFFQNLDGSAVVVAKDMSFIRDRISVIYQEGFSRLALKVETEGLTEMEKEQVLKNMHKENRLLKPHDFDNEIQRFSHILIKADTSSRWNFNTSAQPVFHKNFDLLADFIRQYQQSGFKISVLADSQKQVTRIQDILKEYNLELSSYVKMNKDADVAEDEKNSRGEDDGKKKKVDDSNRKIATIHEGFIDNDLHRCLLTDHQIFDRYHKYTLRSDVARQGKMALTLKELHEMEVGDFVVHVDFGIGKFAGLVRVPDGDGYQEKIRLIYQHGDIVDVSIHSLYKISKYRNGESGNLPKMSILGTGAWERMKEKAKKRIKDIARDLIKLYAKRRHEKGFAYSPDSYLQHELEASFRYEDTPDQMITVADIKTDMESDRPMDRLVCGDVGFGKTEVAVRAAFKAATDGKQVAVLVPTTILAFQHYNTFSGRLKDFPVRVEYLSRARTAKQTKEILADLAEGKVDILIGTHKLIGKNVKWKDLGLLVIDEEQKFGVSTKEKLRALKTNVDTLTMTATPIPRTLQFSLMGARDMSVLRTPPPNRHPISTEISTFNHEVITEAINFEMSRGGQVYFVSDRISSLTEINNVIKKYVPDARVAIGHGRMKPDELEKVVMDFIDYEYDVLLSTTIVENGVDIPNANTIIINNAHHFGLSDLHQMRGRVGRGNRKAFCFLMAPPLALLPTDSRRRLEALETFSELGSGISLAMQDLDIRGAGNLLGAEQSGFLTDLGYETYQKILSQAVSELRNEEFSDLFREEERKGGRKLTGDDFVDDCAFESDKEMYFPDSYVPGDAERMLLYRELSAITTEKQLSEFAKRMEDRFGKAPREAEDLMLVVSLRRLGKTLGAEKISLRNDRLQLQLVSNRDSYYYSSDMFGRVIDFISSHMRHCSFKENNNKRFVTINKVKDINEAYSVMREMRGEEHSQAQVY